MENKRNKNLSATEKFNSIFATRLRNTLTSLQLTQKNLAEAVGVSPQMVSLYCNGQNEPPFATLAAIAKKLNVTTDYLLGLTNNESMHTEIRSVSDYTGLDTNSIKTLHKYQSIPLFMDTVNFLLLDLKLLESIADFLTTPLLDTVTNPPYNNVNLALPIHDKLSSLYAIEIHNCAFAAQKDFAKANAGNKRLQEYVADRYVAKYGTGSSSCRIPQHTHTYNAYDLLHSLCENVSLTEHEEFLQTLEFFGVCDVKYINSVKATARTIECYKNK